MAAPTGLRRTVKVRLNGQVTATADIVLSIAVAQRDDIESETMTITVNGNPVDVQELAAEHGTRLHRIRETPVGQLEVAYDAVVGDDQTMTQLTQGDDITYQRTSRYCPTDELGPVAASIFGDATGRDLVDKVVNWVSDHLSYVVGSSGPTDTAVDTFLRRQGVCRDYAHLTISLLRARGIPARLVSVYAPGLVPMDFHAVVEAYYDDGWHIVDPTRLAPRDSMVRIATGRDAADTAFITTQTGRFRFGGVVVNAIVDPVLPREDTTERIDLS